jgi:squalene-hopene/tetraprenyl-beta-curcumene cyclase
LAAQNDDGGWPACGGALGRDGDDDSRCDTTAVALRALTAWRGTLTKVSDHTHELHTYRGDRVAGAIEGGLHYLVSHQSSDGSWSRQSHGSSPDAERDRAIFVTAQVLAAFRDLSRLSHVAVSKALDWLVTKKQGGGWVDCPGLANEGSAAATVEETAWAVDVLASCGRTPTHQGAAEAGLAWLIDAVEANRHQASAPVGRTLAGLWYDEKLTPLVGTVAALGRQIRQARTAGQTRAVVQATRP